MLEVFFHNRQSPNRLHAIVDRLVRLRVDIGVRAASQDSFALDQKDFLAQVMQPHSGICARSATSNGTYVGLDDIVFHETTITTIIRVNQGHGT